MIYIVVILVTLISAKLFGVKGYRTIEGLTVLGRKRRLRYVIFVSIMFILLMGLRFYQTGRDTEMYRIVYENFGDTNRFSLLFSPGELYIGGVEPGWACLAWLCSHVMSYRGFLFIQSILCIIPFAYVVYRKSYSPSLSFLLYILFNYLTWDMCASRQAPAVAFSLLSVYFYYNENKKKALITYLVALSFHFTAIIVIPFILVQRYINKDGILIAAIIISLGIGSAVMPLLLPYMRIDYTDDISNKSMGHLTYFGFLCLFLAIMYFKRKAKLSNSNSYYLFSVVIILWPMLSSLAPAFRTVLYFLVYICFLIPELAVSYKRQALNRYLIILMTIVIGSVYFNNLVYKPGADVYPYYSVFEYSDDVNYPGLYND